MPDAQRSIRTRLLEAEPYNSELKSRYDKEIQAMLEKKLSPLQRWSWVAVIILGVLMGPSFVALAILLPAAPLLARLGLVATALFVGIWIATGIRVLRRGSLDLKKDTATMAGLTWCFAVMMVTIFLMTMPGTIEGVRAILAGVVVLVGGAAALLRHVTEQEALKTREKLLEIELRVAELAELVKAATPRPPETRG